MPYQVPIERSNPTAVLFLVDQSGSMADRMAAAEKTKAQFVADVLNRSLAELIIRCTKSDSVRDYFHVGVIGYGAQGAQNGLQGALAGSVLHPISALEANPLRIETRNRKIDDGAGGLIERSVRFPVWFEPQANGGTPMCEAIRRAGEELAAWCDAHPAGYPPSVLHVTDGESTDGDPEPLANTLRQFSTSDGNALMLNLHVSAEIGHPIKFPTSDAGLPDAYAKMLFRTSSRLPPNLVRVAQELNYQVSSESTGYVFNAEAADIVHFFDIGTRASELR